MNGQSQWLFEAPVTSEATLYTNPYSNPEWETEWELQEINSYALGEEEWEQESASPSSEKAIRETISGFSRYSNAIPPQERAKIAKIAQVIVQSHRSGQPIRTVRLVGHADLDIQRGASFEKKISGDRALEVQKALIQAIDRYGRKTPLPPLLSYASNNNSLASKITWQIVRAGANQLAIQNPRTEIERMRNRRVDIFAQQRRTPTRRRRRPQPPRPQLPKPDLQITSPVAKQQFFIEPGNPGSSPFLPTVTVSGQALANGLPVSNAQITWTFTISGNYRVRAGKSFRLQRYSFILGKVTIPSGQQSAVDLGSLDTSLIVGGNLDVTATFSLPSGRPVSKTVHCQVLGKNPSREDVEKFIRIESQASGPCGDDSWAILRVFCHESNHNLFQFRSNGEILFGPPAGVGIAQRDPETAEWKFPQKLVTQPNNFFPRIFWNWQENVREGIQFFRKKLRMAQSDLKSLQREANRKGLQLPDFCLGILMRAAIRRYNGGTEYGFRPVSPGSKKAVYFVSPRTPPDRVNYVDQVLGDHGHPQIVLDPIPNEARHVTAQNFSHGDLPCDECTI
jgi:hypothetical protein